MKIYREFTYELSDAQRNKYGFKYPTTLVSDHFSTRVVTITKEESTYLKKHHVDIKYFLKDPKESDELKKFLKEFLDKTNKFHRICKGVKNGNL